MLYSAGQEPNTGTLKLALSHSVIVDKRSADEMPSRQKGISPSLNIFRQIVRFSKKLFFICKGNIRWHKQTKKARAFFALLELINLNKTHLINTDL